MLLSHTFRKCFLLSDGIFLNVRSARLLERFVKPKAEQDGIMIRLTRVTMNYIVRTNTEEMIIFILFHHGF